MWKGFGHSAHIGDIMAHDSVVDSECGSRSIGEMADHQGIWRKNTITSVGYRNRAMDGGGKGGLFIQGTLNIAASSQ